MVELLKQYWPYLAGFVSASWALFVFFDKRARKKPERATVSAKGGAAAGRDITNSPINIGVPPADRCD